MKNKNKSNQVLSFLQKELIHYENLLVTMKKQKEAIINGNESELIKIIQENDKLIETIRMLDQKIEYSFSTISKAEQENLDQQTKILKDQIQNYLGKVIELENTCRNALECQKTEISDQMKTLKERKTLTGKYQSTFSKISSFSKNA